jgi:zinc transport system permease protein
LIQDFISSWSLFGNTYLVGWLVAALLSLIGVLVVARNQIFVGAALSQASTLGIAGAMWVGAALGASAPEWVHADAFLTGVAIAVSVVAALLTARGSGAHGATREAMTGWLFLLGAAGSVVIVSHSPHGLEEVQRLLSSSIIGATRTEVVVFGAATAVTAAAIWAWHRPLLLWVMDPATAAASGVPVAALEAISVGWLGLGIGLSIRASGMLYTFGCLVLPAMAAKTLCREVGTMFLVAPVIAVVGAAAAFIIANHYDFPPAQTAVMVLCVLVPIGWAAGLAVPTLRLAARRRTGRCPACGYNLGAQQTARPCPECGAPQR